MSFPFKVALMFTALATLTIFGILYFTAPYQPSTDIKPQTQKEQPEPLFGSDTLMISHLTPDDGNLANLFDVNWRGQTFTTVGAFTVTSIKIIFGAETGTAPDVTATINTTSASEPTTTILATATKSVNAGTEEFIFSVPAALSATTMYAIVLSMPAGDGSNRIALKGSIPSDTYTDGTYSASADSGANWSNGTTEDLLFEVYGTTGAGASTINPDTIIFE